MSRCSRSREALFHFRIRYAVNRYCLCMRWITAVVIALVVLVAFYLDSLEPRAEPEQDLGFVSEPSNIGVDQAPSLPLDQPISATLFFIGGSGRPDDPYVFCLRSVSRTGGVTCLFDALLLGPPSTMEFGDWYQVTAKFERMPGVGRSPAGDLVSIGDAPQVRVVGRAEERGPRFLEDSEALSNWSAEHELNGFLRLDAAYVWYLTDEAKVDAMSRGIAVRAVWADAR